MNLKDFLTTFINTPMTLILRTSIKGNVIGNGDKDYCIRHYEGWLDSKVKGITPNSDHCLTIWLDE